MVTVFYYARSPCFSRDCLLCAVLLRRRLGFELISKHVVQQVAGSRDTRGASSLGVCSCQRRYLTTRWTSDLYSDCIGQQDK